MMRSWEGGVILQVQVRKPSWEIRESQTGLTNVGFLQGNTATLSRVQNQNSKTKEGQDKNSTAGEIQKQSPKQRGTPLSNEKLDRNSK